MGAGSDLTQIALPSILVALSAVYFADLSPLLRLSIGTSLFCITLFSLTYIYTHLRYIYQLWRGKSHTSKPHKPPAIPYTLPFLGNALEFLAPKPGLFWQNLFLKHPRETGACTLLLGGNTTHILFDPIAVQALFKAKGPTRDRFNEQLLQNAFRFPRSEVIKFYGIGEKHTFDSKGKPMGAKERQEDIWNDFLLKTDAVNELTREFMTRLRANVDSDERLAKGQTLEIG